jgi:hypothetical protein
MCLWLVSEYHAGIHQLIFLQTVSTGTFTTRYQGMRKQVVANLWFEEDNRYNEENPFKILNLPPGMSERKGVQKVCGEWGKGRGLVLASIEQSE